MSARIVSLTRNASTRPRGWWVAPLATAAALVLAAAYVAWAAVSHIGHYAEPYLSPLYSPCLAQACTHASIPWVLHGWPLSPALLVLWIPAGLRVTCYYYRKAYYRSLFLSPPACAVGDASRRYSGESRFPWVLQGLHRYFFYLSLPLLAFLWWDAISAFRFPDRPGVGVGSLILFVNVCLLTSFALSCNACRHLCGGHARALRDAPLGGRAWKLSSALNPWHREFAWASLASVLLADAYVRLVAVQVVHDVRLL